MKIYLSAAWSRKTEVNSVGADLEKSIPGLIVNCRWLKEGPTPDTWPKSRITKARRIRAQEDVEDVLSSDLLVRFTDDLTSEMVPSRLATGARMFEMGLAYAVGIPIVVVAGFQPIFDYLSEVRHVKNVASLKRLLRRQNALHN